MTTETTRSIKITTTIRSSFDVDDCWDISNKEHTKDLFRDVINSYFRNVADYLIETGVDVKMQYSLGHFTLRKEKVEFIIRDNGEVFTNCYVNREATKEVQKTDPFARPIRLMDTEHILRFSWRKDGFRNMSSYYFKKSGEFSKRLFDKAINNDLSNFNELRRNFSYLREDKQG